MKRTTTSVGSYHGYAIYESWRESIEDYYLFQKMLFSTHKFTRASYLNYLDKYYSTSKGYKTALLKIIKNHKILLYPPPSDRNDGSLNNSFVIP
jgi:tRNA splicing ligase